MELLYTLRLKDGKYYVGKTTDVQKRFKEHQNGSGAAWTREYIPVRLLECRPLKDEHDENNITKDYMKKYGIENVRGGSYTQVELPEYLHSALELEFRGNSDTCFKCGKHGHFAKQCPNTGDEKKSAIQHIADKLIRQYGLPKYVEEVEWGCEYCDRTFTTKFGCQVHERSCKDSSSKKTGVVCYRCGRPGHYSTDCYARAHVKGYSLE